MKERTLFFLFVNIKHNPISNYISVTRKRLINNVLKAEVGYIEEEEKRNALKSNKILSAIYISVTREVEKRITQCPYS